MLYTISDQNCNHCLQLLLQKLQQVPDIEKVQMKDNRLEVRTNHEDHLEREIDEVLKISGHTHGFKVDKMHQQEFFFRGLNCINCAGKIEDKIRKLPYIQDTNYDMSRQKMMIQTTSENFDEMQEEFQKIADSIEDGVQVEQYLVKGQVKHTFYFRGLNCTHCAGKIEKSINDLPYIQKANYDFSRQRMVIHTKRNDIEEIRKEFQDLINSIEDGVTVELDQDITQKKDYAVFLKFGITALGLLILHFISLPFFVELTAYGLLFLGVGLPVLKNVIKGTGSLLDENFLMSFAALAAFITGNYSEAVAVMLFYGLGEELQDMAVERSRHSIEGALALKPEYANVKRDGQMIKISPEDVKVGERIVIRPGEKIPLDGKILLGKSELDTSAITGESIPQFVEEGDDIVSGSLNINGMLEVEVTKSYESGTIGKILEMVENASAQKAPVEKFITRFAKIYTPIVVGIAALMAITMPLITGDQWSFWIYRACVFLVISCPCALVLSVPLGIFAGIGAMSKQGIFVKGGNYIEALSDVKTIAFDKTGTITQGKFHIDHIEVVEGSYTEEEILALAAMGEQFSTHPLAIAIVNSYKGNLEGVQNFKEWTGKGISYQYQGRDILVGNEKLLRRFKLEISKNIIPGAAIYVACDHEVIGLIVLKDQLKQNVYENLRLLEKEGIHSVILSGDGVENVKDVADELSVDEYYGSLLPLEKVEKIEEFMKTREGKVAFVGDGTNDAPVLTRADVGIAMGFSGSDIAVESSDIVLLHDEISKITEAVTISKKTKIIVYQNITLALGFKILILILGFFGIASMWLAVFADVGVALLAVLNAIRALYLK
ncbi:MAG: heavy metal translocating P-type ATPase [Tissierellia bacterium]|nr:heavy metal translocating P-type ATPase [Tissierellia bacterium]